jgi:Mor family transcriptional regulator
MKGRYITEEHKKKLHELYKGEKSLTAKLTEQQVIEIRLRFLKGEKQCDIKKDYQVSAQTIYDIVRNRRWRHIPNTIKELEKIKEAK